MFDKMVLRVAMLIMAMAVGMLSFDIALFASRSLLHCNPKAVSSSNRLMLNYIASLVFSQAMISTLIEMVSCNLYFRLFLL